MPKVKTKSAAKKRFKKTGGKSIKIKRARSLRRHILTKMTTKRKRKLRKGSYISKADYSNILKLLPY